ncbi:3242_t:CDS:1 [Ambispora gerdemannii]|uniref:3242_t:CDS:1 n=1 Tax=Ambispora gerdemannii TaxID=144530 RepID=A0A9N9GKA9_9GLOM|nr:3242_t:CDS:1 [Ambispora gerdemannii]
MRPDQTYEIYTESESEEFDNDYVEGDSLFDSCSEVDDNDYDPEAEQRFYEEETYQEFCGDFERENMPPEFFQALRERVSPILELKNQLRILTYRIDNNERYTNSELLEQESTMHRSFEVAFPGDIDDHPDKEWRIFRNCLDDARLAVEDLCSLLNYGQLCLHSHWPHYTPSEQEDEESEDEE